MKDDNNTQIVSKSAVPCTSRISGLAQERSRPPALNRPLGKRRPKSWLYLQLLAFSMANFAGRPPLQAHDHNIATSQQKLGVDASNIYRCPHCSFPCWLCNLTEGRDPPEEVKKGVKTEEEMGTPSATSSRSSKRKRTDGLKYLGPKDELFETFILRSVGTDIRGGFQLSKPEQIPYGDNGDNENQSEPSFSSNVYLSYENLNAAHINSQFLQLHQRQYDENTLKKLFTKYLAPFDSFVLVFDPQVIISHCRDKWRPKKSGPDVPTISGYTYDWDLEPDMTYMVGLNIFQEDLRDEMRGPELIWLLAEAYGVAPYLTIEFKCTEKSGKDSEAVCQIAATSVIWIHQRKILKERLQQSDTADLRHYSIVVNSLTFQIWLTVFDGRKYRVQMIDYGSLNFPEGIEKYVNWWNGIHKWGLGANTRSFKQDVELLWERMNNARVEITPPVSEES